VLVLGISALATLRGITAVLRVNSVDRVGAYLGAGQDLPSLAAAALGGSTPALAAALGGALALAIVAWVLARPEGAAATSGSAAPASAPPSSPSGGSRAGSATSPSIPRRSRRRSSPPTRAGWSRSAWSPRSATRSTG
jgi:hypothetical protein